MKKTAIFLLIALIMNQFKPAVQAKPEISLMDQVGNVTRNSIGLNGPEKITGFHLSTGQLSPYEYAEVSTYASGGTYHSGPVIGVLAADINGDGLMEICFSGLSSGPLYCGTYNGDQLPGFPISQDTWGVEYPVAAQLDQSDKALEIFSGSFGVITYGSSKLFAVNGQGQLLPGWPIISKNYISSPWSATSSVTVPDLALGGEEDWHLYGLNASGGNTGGYPVMTYGNQRVETPAIAGNKVFTANSSSSTGVSIYGFGLAGTPLPGFPIQFPHGGVDTYIVGRNSEGVTLIIPSQDSAFNWILNLVNGDTGQIVKSVTTQLHRAYYLFPVLADLDYSGDPDIIVQDEHCVGVWDWQLNPKWKWCDTDATRWANDANPVVADINGDGWPEIVVPLSHYTFQLNHALIILDHTGQIVYRIDLPSLGSAGNPAAGDFDNDGIIEVAVRYDYWDGNSGYQPTVGLFRFPQKPGGHPCIVPDWGQFQRDERHSGIWQATGCVKPPAPKTAFLPLILK